MNPLRHPALIAAMMLAGFAGMPAQAAQPHLSQNAPNGQQAARRATIELLFVLDTTGSMGGMLEGAKARIWCIVNDVLQQQGNGGATIRVGLVAYRDRGDAYVTRITPLTDNLDAVYAQLMRFRAQGGGDGPEDVRSAMAEAVRVGGWSAPGPRTSQVLFLVGDAPPHNDYRNLPPTDTSARNAATRGIIVNTIQCGDDADTTRAWRTIAQYGGGEYFAIAQDGGVDVVVTPYDEPLARLGEQIGGTYLAYGASDKRVARQSAQVAMETSVVAAAPPAAKAERALNKALNDKAYDDSDLVQQAESGKLALPQIAEAELPDSLRKLAPAQRQAALDKAVAQRKALREQIVALSKQREKYLAEQRGKGGSKGGFDAAVSHALARQIK
ncbi:vWA domain-containing protein [Massilia sp. TWP1-3-3]|uniref:vWA domain-containing protein n=1 Tax=Massilia sp. TWP1-3-3 TaxID=2804573 RepID=UPI003CF293CD